VKLPARLVGVVMVSVMMFGVVMMPRVVMLVH
jgi:hypothetical protein